MRIICVSFDVMGQACFEAMHQLGADIAALVTLEGEIRPARSGQCSFEELARRLDTRLLKCKNINEPALIESLRATGAEAAFVIGWSQLVSAEFMGLWPRGTYGMHPTLLPRHRGRAPLPWAVISGLRVTGVSLFHIAQSADDGDLVGQLEIPVYRVDAAQSLYDRVLRAHVQLVREYYPLIASGQAPRIKQDPSRATHWEKRVPADGLIDWSSSADAMYDWIRAQSRPYPGAFTFGRSGKLVIWATDLPAPLNGGRPGAVVALDCRGALVQTGQDGLWITRAQPAERPDEFEGHEIATSGLFQVGEILG